MSKQPKYLAVFVILLVAAGFGLAALAAPSVPQDIKSTPAQPSDSQMNPSASSASGPAVSATLPQAPDSTLASTPDSTSELDQTFKPRPDLAKICEESLKRTPHSAQRPRIPQICAKVQQLPGCTSVKSEPIYHFNFDGDPKSKKTQNILVFALTHGDEDQSGSVALSWLDRLQEIQPRNRWRVIPVLNPDGFLAKTRTNANGVDVNRNFPSQDWDDLALKYWKAKAGSAERRFPGDKSGSEPETKCAMNHIEDFKPNFIISIHTPLGVLDFDGPKVEMPKFAPLPWVSLGNFPGSLGRYMWVDHKVPVMTVELKAMKLAARQLEEFDKLQDISGTVALQTEKALQKKKALTASGRDASTSPVSQNR